MNRYQTLERRLGALIVDLLILVVPIATIDYLISVLEPSLLLLLPWTLVSTFANAVYFILLHGLYGQTLGKMLLRVKVVRHDDESPISMYQAFLRDIFAVLFGIVSFVGQAIVAFFPEPETYETWPVKIIGVILLIALPWILAEVLSALKTIKRRAVHDFIAGTVVVRTDLLLNNRLERTVAAGD